MYNFQVFINIVPAIKNIEKYFCGLFSSGIMIYSYELTVYNEKNEFLMLKKIQIQTLSHFLTKNICLYQKN